MTQDRILSGSGKQNGKEVSFYHEDVGKLVLYTGINDIEWGYKLNTASFPTYGGEVIQILGSSVEVMNIQGDLKTYKDMTDVYSFFFEYFQIATQGKTGNAEKGKTRYNQKPMTFTYHERGWEFHIQPMSAPGFRIGREVVVPSWRISTHVEHFHGSDLKQEIANSAALSQRVDPTGNYSADKSDYSFFSLKADTGYVEGSPFTDPFGSVDGAVTGKGNDASSVIKKNSEFYKQLLPSYMAGDFENLLYGFSSKPAAGNGASETAEDSTKRGVTELKKAVGE